MRASYTVPASERWDFDPTPLVRLPWGSISTSNTLDPESARDVAKLMAVVVLPTPPFWLATATIRLLALLSVIQQNLLNLVSD